MPTIPRAEAMERLAAAVEQAFPEDLVEIYGELFPEKARPAVAPPAKELAEHVRKRIEPEELVDLWNVVFPAQRILFYDEEEEALHYEERDLRYAEPY